MLKGKFCLTTFAIAVLLFGGATVGQETTKGNLIGAWSGESFLPGTKIEIVSLDGTPTLFMYFSDGSVLESKLVETEEAGGRRFNQVDDPTEWYVLRDDGHLDAVSSLSGVFNTFPPQDLP
jgi:hypothetical protein